MKHSWEVGEWIFQQGNMYRPDDAHRKIDAQIDVASLPENWQGYVNPDGAYQFTENSKGTILGMNDLILAQLIGLRKTDHNTPGQ